MFRRYCRDLTALFIVVVALALAMSGCAGHKQTISGGSCYAVESR